MIVALSILFSLFLSGYLAQVYRGAKPAPDFKGWGCLVVDSLKMQIVGLAGFLPVIIVFVCTVALALFLISSPNPGSPFLLLLLLVLLLFGIIILVLVALLSVMGIIRFACTGSTTEGIRDMVIMGFISEDGMRRILHHKALKLLPFICETPVDDRQDDRGNIAKVRELAR